MKQLKKVLSEHIASHPALEVRDAVKLIYQNEFGPGHMIADEAAALARTAAEMASCRHSDVPVYETIGGGLCRLNLCNLRGRLSPLTVTRMFIITANSVKGDLESFKRKLSVLDDLPLDKKALGEYLAAYAAAGCPMVSHTKAYHDAYSPAYRVVLEVFGENIGVFAAADRGESPAVPEGIRELFAKVYPQRQEG